jgi:hypothetical protein
MLVLFLRVRGEGYVGGFGVMVRVSFGYGGILCRVFLCWILGLEVQLKLLVMGHQILELIFGDFGKKVR